MLKLHALAASIAAACVLALAGCAGGIHQSAGGSVHPAGWGRTPKGYVLPHALFTLTPTATMYDSVDVGQIPAHPFAAAGYTAGSWATWPRIRALAQHAISIAIHSSYRADCLDDEPGDATPSEAGPWALQDIRAGFRVPCVYSDLSEMPAVKASLARWLGSGWRARVMLWLAWYRGVPGLVTGYDAVQYWDHCLGRNLDCSTVSLRFLKIAQPPYVAPAPKPKPRPKPKPPVRKPRPAPHSNANACKTLKARASWFAVQLRRHSHVKTASRRRALASTDRALKALHCR